MYILELNIKIKIKNKKLGLKLKPKADPYIPKQNHRIPISLNMVEGMWCFCYMLRHIHRTIVYEILTPPAGFTHYKCECDAAFNRRWKQYKFFYKMEQVTHKHLDWTHGTHKLSRGLPHRVDPLDDFLLYWEDWEEGGERERNNFPFYVFGRKDKKVGSWKICLSFLYLMGKEN